MAKEKMVEKRLENWRKKVRLILDVATLRNQVGADALARKLGYKNSTGYYSIRREPENRLTLQRIRVLKKELKLTEEEYATIANTY